MFEGVRKRTQKNPDLHYRAQFSFYGPPIKSLQELFYLHVSGHLQTRKCPVF